MTGAGVAGNNSEKTGRIRSLDFLRGVAVLGMLVANVPWHAGDSMSRVIEPDFWSVSAWLSQYLIFDQRFVPIFCMLFGASIYLLAGPAGTTKGFSIYYLRRMAVLLLLGVMHAYILWPGDILITYAVCGPFLLLFYRAPVWTLVLVGISFKTIGLLIGEWPQIYFETLDKWLFSWVEYGDAPSSISEAYAGTYADLFAYNAWRNQFLQWTALPYFRIWSAFGFMLIGMALFRSGALQGRKDAGFYKKWAVIGLCIGLPLVLYGILARVGSNPTVGPFMGFTTELPLQNITFRTGCSVLSLALLSAIHFLYPNITGQIKRMIEAIGKTALTNYIFHSIFFLIVFHVFMPGAFDTLDPDILFLFVVGVWAIQLVGSDLWLKRYRQGPLEAAWRLLAGQKGGNPEQTNQEMKNAPKELRR